MKYVLILFISLFISSCTYQKGLLENGMSRKERKFQIVQNGAGLSQKVKDNFIKGLPCEGMHVNMIFDMYGEPNFKGVLERDSDDNIKEYKWTYYIQDREKGWDLKIILDLIFDENHYVKVVLGEPCEILDECAVDINSGYEK